jgi:hypothetical protein
MPSPGEDGQICQIYINIYIDILCLLHMIILQCWCSHFCIKRQCMLRVRTRSVLLIINAPQSMPPSLHVEVSKPPFLPGPWQVSHHDHVLVLLRARSDYLQSLSLLFSYLIFRIFITFLKILAWRAQIRVISCQEEPLVFAWGTAIT